MILFKKKYFIPFLVLLIIIKLISDINFPMLGSDGPWSISPAYSYIDGLKDSSVFAHNFLGRCFTVHCVDIVYKWWFTIFHLNTYSFIFLQFLIIFLTLIIWIRLLAKFQINKIYFLFLLLGYFLSPYLFGFRLENFVVLTQSILFLILFSKINSTIKLIIVAFLCVYSGLIHHIGGLITVLILSYYYLFVSKNLINYFKFIILGIIISFAITNGEIINYLLLPTKFSSEVSNHLSGFNFLNIIKYFIFSGFIPLMLFIFLRNIFTKKDWFFIIIFFIVLSFLGRSYYVVYSYVLLLFLMLIRLNSIEQFSPIFTNKFNKIIALTTCLYSLLILFLIPISLTFLTQKPNKQWQNCLLKMKEEKKSWNNNTTYFVPSQLSLEVVDKINSRLLYSFMLHNDGIQNVNNKVFYIFEEDQLYWIKKNFDIKNHQIHIQQIITKTQGHYVISSFYKLKKVRTSPFGLWKVSFVDKKK